MGLHDCICKECIQCIWSICDVAILPRWNGRRVSSWTVLLSLAGWGIVARTMTDVHLFQGCHNMLGKFFMPCPGWMPWLWSSFWPKHRLSQLMTKDAGNQLLHPLDEHIQIQKHSLYIHIVRHSFATSALSPTIWWRIVCKGSQRGYTVECGKHAMDLGTWHQSVREDAQEVEMLAPVFSSKWNPKNCLP